jgi:UDP-N-acetyl-D-galactosamine dehydrogenase
LPWPDHQGIEAAGDRNAQDINIAFIDRDHPDLQGMDILDMDVLAAARTKWNFLLVRRRRPLRDGSYLSHRAQELGHDA